MKNEKDKDNKEETTKYGEFIASYFAWQTLDEQKKVSNKLADITNKKKE